MVKKLFRAAAAHDGVSPINESGELVLRGQRPGEIYDRKTAAAIADLRDGTIMLAVHPEHRRKGHGTALLRQVLADHPNLTVWAFDSLKGSAALARKVGLRARRTLLRMERPLTSDDVIPDDATTGFTPRHADTIVALNAAAFAHHPEQGKLTRREFDNLCAQPWFRPEGLRLLHVDGTLAGFHWTKQHGDGLGEVYVIAVHPQHEQQGFGRMLLAAGLSHLREQRCDRAQLYVEGKEERVVNMYEAAGFRVVAKDTSYERIV